MLKSLLEITICLCLIGLLACKHEVEDPEVRQGNLNSATIVDTICDDQAVYFVNDVLPLLNSKCSSSGCHGNGSAQDGVSLETYALVMQTAEVVPGNPQGSELIEVILDTDSDERMPPAGSPSLSANEIAMLQDWVSQGALNNECVEVQCDTLNVTFSGTIEPLINQKCLGCHSAATSSNKGVTLRNYMEVKSWVDDGALLGSILGNSNYSKMPQGGELPSCEVEQLIKWINEGAPNN